MPDQHPPSFSLPRWARAAMRLAPLGDRRPDVESDLQELFDDRRRRYGAGHAHWRLLRDVSSLWRTSRRGGGMGQDLRFALRLFRKHPGPIAISIAGLGLAIGVVTSVFSVINSTLLRPWGVDDPKTVVQMNVPGHAFAHWPHTSFQRMRAASSVVKIEGSIGTRARFAESAADVAYDVRVVDFVSGSYFDTFGGRPAIGRPLTAADDDTAAPLAAVASHAFWTSRLGGDAAVVGRVIRLNETAVTIVGVLPPSFTGPTDLAPALWLPLSAWEPLGYGPITAEYVETIGRLAPGATLAAASENLTSILVNALTSPSEEAKRRAVVTVARSSSPFDAEDDEVVIVLLSVGIVMSLVLALACANTANLLLAGATTRMREIGIRLALGSSRRRLVRQMITESLLLSAMAGAFGVACAFVTVPLAANLVDVPAEFAPAVDIRVLAFTAIIAMLCGFVAGVAPARYGTRGDVLAATRAQDGRGRRPITSRVRRSFVGLQAAMSILLLVVSALLARTAVATATTEVGFDDAKLIGVSISSPRGKFDESAYVRDALAALRNIPSVERASATRAFPFGRSFEWREVAIGRHVPQLLVSRADEAYFQTLGVALRRGRIFTADEVRNEAKLAVIGEHAAQAYFAGADPIGQSITLTSIRTPETLTVVGVVNEALLGPAEGRGAGTVYVPLRRTWDNIPALLVRTSAPGPTAHAIEETLRRLNSRVPVRTEMVQAGIDSYLRSKRAIALMAAPIALLALVLAALGVYGVTAFVVGQRTQEISVRMAIGATTADINRLLTRDNLRPVAIGLGIGLLASVGIVRVIASQLVSMISAYDPAAWLGATATLMVTACLAVYFPTRRAARVDPASVLRQV